MLSSETRYCQQCGACKAVCPAGAISFTPCQNGLNRILVDNTKCIRCRKCIRVCPSNREAVFDQSYFDALKEKKYFLAANSDTDIARKCSSGGACKTMIIDALTQGLVDGVYSLKKTDHYPFAEGELYTKDNLPDFDSLPNSIYHSVMSCENLNRINRVNRLMIVGTACQLHALSVALKGKVQSLVKICIFCKQQKTFDSTRYFARILHEDISVHSPFLVSYRGNGWPGFVTLNHRSIPYAKASVLPFGRRLWTVPGCDICGDPFGQNEDADLTLMDPWGIGTAHESGQTLVVVGSAVGLQLLNDISGLEKSEIDYPTAKVSLGLKDIWRKQVLIPYYKGKSCSELIRKAGMAETRQRLFLTSLIEHLPSMPFLFYRLLNKFIPRRRNAILQDSEFPSRPSL